jgi:hypothetical protein
MIATKASRNRVRRQVWQSSSTNASRGVAWDLDRQGMCLRSRLRPRRRTARHLFSRRRRPGTMTEGWDLARSANRALPRPRSATRPKLTFLRGDAEALPFASASFDVVVQRRVPPPPPPPSSLLPTTLPAVPRRGPPGAPAGGYLLLADVRRHGHGHETTLRTRSTPNVKAAASRSWKPRTFAVLEAVRTNHRDAERGGGRSSSTAHGGARSIAKRVPEGPAATGADPSRPWKGMPRTTRARKAA